MANVTLIIVNSTDSDVTVNAQVAKARAATKLVISDASTDAYGFLAAKCAVISQSASGVNPRDAEKSGYLMNRLARYQY